MSEGTFHPRPTWGRLDGDTIRKLLLLIMDTLSAEGWLALSRTMEFLVHPFSTASASLRRRPRGEIYQATLPVSGEGRKRERKDKHWSSGGGDKGKTNTDQFHRAAPISASLTLERGAIIKEVVGALPPDLTEW